MTTESVPVIDITSLSDPATLAALDAACREWGFFQVTHHGIDHDVIDALRRKMRAFFALPDTAKQRIARTAGNPWGYFDHELTKNTLDWKQVFDYGPAVLPEDGSEPVIVPQWPRDLPHFKPAVLAYYRACEDLALTLLDAIAQNLGMPPGALTGQFRPQHTSFVRLNYYPVCPTPARPADARAPEDGYLGVNHHTDAGVLTVLLQDDVPGLEVYRNGAWHGVAPRDDALVINIGDIVQVWSNDRYTAALHRVTTNSERDRYSAPFFLNPTYESSYAPLPSTVDTAHPPRYRPINWGEFRSQRAAGDYADQGEEIQISHYAVGA
ncbi:MAG: 2OG-Fe(II) oxygenase family protein [Pseudomonadales bacterium]|jgi:isopenicillin N synthase-like dioxygenase